MHAVVFELVLMTRGRGQQETYFIYKVIHHLEISLSRRGSPQRKRRPVVEPAQGGVVLWPQSIFAQSALQRQDDGDTQAGLEMCFSKEAIDGCECRYSGPGVSGSEAELEDAGARELQSWAGAGVVACEA